ncbi:MAG: DNA alkylation repair protein [Bacillota bacterium]|jgi:3-methyladenine DNA glycosylase AlkD
MTQQFKREEWTNLDYQSLVEYMKFLADEKFRAFSKKLIPNTVNVIGVPMPVIQSLAKQIAKGNWRQYLHLAGAQSHEELLLQAAVIGHIKVGKDIDTQEMLSLISDFVPQINNWAVCDTFCAGLKFVYKNKPEMYAFLQKYLLSDREFELRFVTVMLMLYFIDDDYVEELFNIFDSIKHDGYYVKMALAWALSMCFIKYRQKTIAYLKDNSLDNFTYNKALQKIIESQRVTIDDKNMIRKMKRK